MAKITEIKTGTSFSGKKYCDIVIDNQKYIGRGDNEKDAIKAAEMAVYIDFPHLQKNSMILGDVPSKE